MKDPSLLGWTASAQKISRRVFDICHCLLNPA